MNEVIAGIYSTAGHEKVASVEGGDAVATLSDLALLLAIEAGTPQDDLEKLASVHEEILNDLVEFDQSGRAMAHYKLSEFEQKAAEGDPSELEAYFADLLPAEEPEKTASLKERALAELLRRQAG